MTKFSAEKLSPRLNSKTPVDWMFAFKFNAHSMPGDVEDLKPTGIFDAPGITRPPYDDKSSLFSRHYLVASSKSPALKIGGGKDIIGASEDDPLGATFAQVYLSCTPPSFILWNDQFYGEPISSRGAPWGHSKGMLAWDNDGNGFVLQTSTPSWPAAGNKKNPRLGDGNTLGFVGDDNIEVSQHFFALKLNSDDVVDVLKALQNASVRTDPTNPILANIGGPEHIQKQARMLGKRQKGKECLNTKLSNGVRLISKPSDLHVPPWQLVSAELEGVDLRVASWWAHPKIFSTNHSNRVPDCWDESLGLPGAVDIATTGTWHDATDGVLGLEGGLGAKFNHAKLGVSTSDDKTYSIFGDMNQQGSLTKDRAKSSQNGRGGLFFVMDDADLHESMSGLLYGCSASIAK